MAERLHPGVFVEERRTGQTPIQGVSTSNGGFAGFTARGPTNVAGLVTSFDQFDREYGGFTADSQLPTHVFAFFANGGRRAYVVRVVPADAVVSDGFLGNHISEEALATGDGATKDYTGGGSGPLLAAEVPIRDGVGGTPGFPTVVAPSVAITYEEGPTSGVATTIGGAAPAMTLADAASPFVAADVGRSITIVGATTPANDGTFPITGFTGAGLIAYTNAAGVAEAFAGTWTIGPRVAEPMSIDAAFDGVAGVGTTDTTAASITGGKARIIPGTVTLNTLVSAAPIVYVDTLKDGVLLDSSGDARGLIDYETGNVVMSWEEIATGGVADAVPDAASAMTMDYTPVRATATLVDDGAGAITGASLAAPGTIDYDTGSIEFTIAAIAAPPADTFPIEISYIHEQWDIDPISAGVWGDDVRLDVRGDEDFFTRATASYSRHDALVYLRDEDGIFQLQEVFESVSLTSPIDTAYIGTVINAPGTGSDLISLVEPSNSDTLPNSINGKARSRAIGIGNGVQLDFGTTDGTGGTPTIPVIFRVSPLPGPIQPGSVVMTYTQVGGLVRTITDDGSGGLTGVGIDAGAPAGFNTINYATGAFAFRLTTAISEPDTIHGAPASSLADIILGAKGVSAHWRTQIDTVTQDQLAGGDDGTSVTRAELTSPALLADREGVYALLVPDELQNVVVPDAAGDVVMSLDLLTEAQRNEKWFIILATPEGLTPLQAQSYRRNDLASASSYGALYYPYLQIADPVTDLTVNFPPGGHISGIYARTDNNKSVGKAPAGVEDGQLNFIVGLERNLEFAEIDVLHPFQVNAIVDKSQTGRAVWGARTLENPPNDFRFIHVRRLFNFLKASIFNSTHGFVFENVGTGLYDRIRLSVESFMLTLFNQGLFAGTTPQDGFLVVCDETNNPKAVADAGEVICDVFVATNVPGEFITFRLQQKVALAA